MTTTEPTTDTPKATAVQIGTYTPTGDIYIALDNGTRIYFPTDLVVGIAAGLANHCENNDERAFVQSEWCEIDEDDE